jgi:hypothetical protein
MFISKSVYQVRGWCASLHSQQVVHGILLRGLGFGPVEIHQLDRAAGFDPEVERLVEVEGVPELASTQMRPRRRVGHERFSMSL